MFNFFKEKIKKAFEKIKGTEEDLEEESKEAKKEIKEEKKKVEKLKKEEKGLKKEEKKKEKEAKEAEKSKKEEIKEDIKEIKEEVKKVEEKKEERIGILGRIKERLITSTLTQEGFEELFEPLELALIENNFSIKIIRKLKERLEKELVEKPFKKSEVESKIKEELKNVIRNSIIEPFDLIEKIREKKDKPFTIVFFGINGAGKTTTIAKIAHRLHQNKMKCVLAAADTFRAASIEQLEKHAQKLDVKVVKHDYGADPAAVAFDAIAHARSKNIDVVLIDTAGRMHTKTDLMKEMEKICRVAKPDLKIFVGEAITGSDLLEQLSKFNDSIGIDAAILTKADVDEKGGALISVGEVTGKPIIFLGMGQEYGDLKILDKEKILESLF